MTDEQIARAVYDALIASSENGFFGMFEMPTEDDADDPFGGCCVTIDSRFNMGLLAAAIRARLSIPKAMP